MFLKNGQNLSVPSTTCQKVQEDNNDGYYVKVKIEVLYITCLLRNLTCFFSVSNVQRLANSLTVVCYSTHYVAATNGSPMDQSAAYFRQAATPLPHPK